MRRPSSATPSGPARPPGKDRACQVAGAWAPRKANVLAAVRADARQSRRARRPVRALRALEPCRRGAVRPAPGAPLPKKGAPARADPCGLGGRGNRGLRAPRALPSWPRGDGTVRRARAPRTRVRAPTHRRRHAPGPPPWRRSTRGEHQPRCPRLLRPPRPCHHRQRNDRRRSGPPHAEGTRPADAADQSRAHRAGKA